MADMNPSQLGRASGIIEKEGVCEGGQVGMVGLG